MITPREIAHRLAQDAEGFCRWLLPNGRREGAEWRVGSVEGEPGKSLGVHLTGEKAGVWADFNGGRSGDLLDLLAAVRGLTLAEAIREAKGYLGIVPAEFQAHRPPRYRKPEKPDCVRPRGAVERYLREERKLSREAIEAYRIAASKDDAWIVFPYLRDGELVNVKYLKLERTPAGKKLMRLERDCEPCLFGWQAIPDDARTVTLCEGEIDALSLLQYGFPALSVFSGAGNHAWVEHEFERLERFDEIFIAFDQDEAGQKGARELVERLGRSRCKLVRLPAKDANECLRRGVPAEDIRQAFVQAATLDPHELRSAAAFVEEVIRQFYPPEGEERGLVMPWAKLAGKLVLRPAELAILHGVNGHGKSELAGHLVLEALRQGVRACVFSGELKPFFLLSRLTRQAAAVARPTEPFIRAVHDWYAERLWLFELVGSAKTERLLEVFTYARARYGVGFFVIDSLLKCGIPEDDYRAQKDFVERLCDFKNEHDVTVLLVAHPRKGDGEHERPDKLDVRGAGAITDLADTVVSIWRNKRREEALAQDPEDAEALSAPGALLTVQKQRNGEWEGKAALWLDPESHQFLEHPKGQPRRYVQRVAPVAQVAGGEEWTEL